MQIPQSVKPLLTAALEARGNAYAPYSEFLVGAAVQTATGEIYTGSNMENASFGLTMCAEVGALQAATTAGQLSQVLRIAIAGGVISGAASVEAITTPCGRCRQLILEAAQLGGTDIEVWCADARSENIEVFSISELIPHAFGIGQLTKIEDQSK